MQLFRALIARRAVVGYLVGLSSHLSHLSHRLCHLQSRVAFSDFFPPSVTAYQLFIIWTPGPQTFSRRRMVCPSIAAYPLVTVSLQDVVSTTHRKQLTLSFWSGVSLKLQPDIGIKLYDILGTFTFSRVPLCPLLYCRTADGHIFGNPLRTDYIVSLPGDYKRVTDQGAGKHCRDPVVNCHLPLLSSEDKTLDNIQPSGIPSHE